jgi:hypothetical protein
MALSNSVNVDEKDGVVHSAPVIASDIIYRGAIVMYSTTGYLAPAATGAGNIFAGISEEEIDNSAGAAGDLNCRYKKEGCYLLTGAGLAQTDIGEFVYASADDTITKTSTNNPMVGQIVEYVSATQVWVKLERNPVAAA